MLRAELYDLAEKIIAARSAPVSRKRIEAAKRSSRMLVVRLDEVPPVDINYDTIVVEERVLHVYPDVYSRGTNRVAKLRAELESADMDAAKLNDGTLRQILRKVSRRTQFVVDVSSIEMPLLPEVVASDLRLPHLHTASRRRGLELRWGVIDAQRGIAPM